MIHQSRAEPAMVTRRATTFSLGITSIYFLLFAVSCGIVSCAERAQEELAVACAFPDSDPCPSESADQTCHVRYRAGLHSSVSSSGVTPSSVNKHVHTDYGHQHDHDHHHHRTNGVGRHCAHVGSSEDLRLAVGERIRPSGIGSNAGWTCVDPTSFRCLFEVTVLSPVVALCGAMSGRTAAYVASLITALASVIGIALIPFSFGTNARLFSAALLTFALGATLADTLLHLLPHAYAHAPTSAGYAILAGILVFFFADKALAVETLSNHNHASHDKPPLALVKPDDHGNMIPDHDRTDRSIANIEEAHPTADGWAIAVMSLAADGLHNFCDGVRIGGMFRLSVQSGWTTTLIVFLHELPQEVGDYVLLRRGGFSRLGALVANVLCAMTSVAGTAAALHTLERLEGIEVWVAPFCAGGMLYTAIAGILPQVEHDMGEMGQNALSWRERSARFLVVLLSGLGGVGVVQLVELSAQAIDGHVH